jgi:hypothetical protein
MSRRTAVASRALAVRAAGVALAGGLGCGDAPTGAGAASAVISVLRRPAVEDTVVAPSDAPVVVEVRDARGRPAAGVALDVAAPETGVLDGREGYPALLLSADTVGGRGGSLGALALRTDGAGRAAFRVIRTALAGSATVTVRVPTLGASETLPFTTLPGALAGVRVVRGDRAVRVGAEWTVLATPIDRHGNPRPDAVRLALGRQLPMGDPGAAPDAPVVALESAGAVRALRTGRAEVTATVGTYAATATISVVPAGRLVVVQRRGGGPDTAWVVLVDLDGAAVRRFPLPRYSDDGRPRWTPDGARVVMSQTIADGSNPLEPLRVVALDTATGRATRLTAPTPALVGEFDPDASRDGAWVYFAGAVERPQFQTSTTIFRTQVGGPAPAIAERVGPPVGAYVALAAPSVSPDGRRVALVRATPSGAPELAVLDVASGEVAAVTGAGEAYSPAGVRWSPSSAWIAFQRAGALMLVRPDGTGLRRVAEAALPVEPTIHGGGISAIDWSPDERWLVLRGLTGLVLVDPATHGVLPLPWSSRYVQPAWRPTP